MLQTAQGLPLYHFRLKQSLLVYSDRYNLLQFAALSRDSKILLVYYGKELYRKFLLLKREAVLY